MPSVTMMLSGATVAGGNPGGFLWKRTVTIDHTQVGSSDTTNFPLLVTFTDATLKTVGNGGHVQSASGYDIGFYSDSALTTKLDWEREKFVAGTGEVIFWVRVPTVSHSADTVIYMAYDSTSVTTDQSNKTGVWGANAKSVLHLGDGSSLSVADSSTQNETWNTSGPPTAGTGQIYGGMVNSASQFIFSNTDLPSTSWTNLTAQCWFNPSSVAGAEHGIFSHGASTSPSFLCQLNGATLKFYVDGNYRESSQTLSTATWYFLTLTLSISGGVSTWKFYKNGSLLSTYTGGANPANFGSTNNVLGLSSGYNGNPPGTYDEYRFMLETHSGDQILGEYNNQKASSTLVTIGAETAA